MGGDALVTCPRSATWVATTTSPPIVVNMYVFIYLFNVTYTQTAMTIVPRLQSSSYRHRQKRQLKILILSNINPSDTTVVQTLTNRHFSKKFLKADNVEKWCVSAGKLLMRLQELCKSCRGWRYLVLFYCKWANRFSKEATQVWTVCAGNIRVWLIFTSDSTDIVT